MSSRCTGHCCKKFFLPMTPPELEAELQRAKAGESKYLAAEVIKVAAMVIPIETETRMDGTPIQEGDHGHFYTCKHLDAQTGNCLNYENRPLMCSNYPYGQPCKVQGCTWANACAATKTPGFDIDVHAQEAEGQSLPVHG